MIKFSNMIFSNLDSHMKSLCTLYGHSFRLCKIYDYDMNKYIYIFSSILVDNDLKRKAFTCYINKKTYEYYKEFVDTRLYLVCFSYNDEIDLIFSNVYDRWTKYFNIVSNPITLFDGNILLDLKGKMYHVKSYKTILYENQELDCSKINHIINTFMSLQALEDLQERKI